MSGKYVTVAAIGFGSCDLRPHASNPIRDRNDRCLSRLVPLGQPGTKCNAADLINFLKIRQVRSETLLTSQASRSRFCLDFDAQFSRLSSAYKEAGKYLP